MVTRIFSIFRSTAFYFLWKKNIVKTDYLIDDNPRQLQIFEGEPIIFTAAHNINETRFKRVNGWKDVEAMFLNNTSKGMYEA